jgi:hypothetical protein
MTQQSLRPARRLLAALTCAALCGCGGAYPASVRGVVTLDGKTLHTGTVTFHPVAGGPAAYGGIQADGTYQIATGASKGLPPGEYIVTVVATELPGNDRAGVAVGKLITPPRYGTMQQSNLRKTVQPGANDIPLDLTAK